MIKGKLISWKYIRHLIVLFFIISLFGSCSGSSFLQSNKLLIADGRINKAISNYRAALKNDAENDEILFALALALFNSGDYVQADKEINKAILLESQFDSYRLLAGKIAFARSDYFKATNQLLNALLLNNSNLEAYYHLALSYQAMGELEKATIQLETAIDIEPLYFDAQLLLAEIMFSNIKTFGSSKTSSEQIENKSAVSTTTTGEESKDPVIQAKDLIVQFKTALASNPKSVKGTLLISDLYAFLGETRKAQAVLSDWIKLYGAVSEEIMLALVNQKYKNGKFSEAISLLDNLQKPSLASNILRLKIQRHQRPNAEFEKQIKELLTTNNDSLELLLMAAQIERQKGNLIDAESYLQSCIDKDPDFSGCYYELSNVMAAQRDVIGSQWALKKAFEITPYDTEVRIEYIESLLSNNAIAEAKDLLSHFSMDQTNPKVAFINAKIAKSQLDFKKADELFQYSRKYVYSVDIETEIADMEILQGKTEQAERRLNSIELTAPGHLKIALLKAALFSVTDRLEKIPAILTPHLKKSQGAGKVHLLLADSYARTGNLPKAIKLLSQGIKIWRKHLDLTNAYTFYLGLNGEYRRAIDILNDIQSFKHKYNELFYHRLRMYYYKAGQLKEFRNLNNYNQLN